MKISSPNELLEGTKVSEIVMRNPEMGGMELRSTSKDKQTETHINGLACLSSSFCRDQACKGIFVAITEYVTSHATVLAASEDRDSTVAGSTDHGN